jgi:hypothetical protein
VEVGGVEGQALSFALRNNETWESVARTHGVMVRELIANNCGPDVTPQEINSYLQTRVGCKVTFDHKNWAFSDSASPGVIYNAPSLNRCSRAIRN